MRSTLAFPPSGAHGESLNASTRPRAPRARRRHTGLARCAGGIDCIVTMRATETPASPRRTGSIDTERVDEAFASSTPRGILRPSGSFRRRLLRRSLSAPEPARASDDRAAFAPGVPSEDRRATPRVPDESSASRPLETPRARAPGRSRARDASNGSADDARDDARTATGLGQHLAEALTELELELFAIGDDPDHVDARASSRADDRASASSPADGRAEDAGAVPTLVAPLPRDEDEDEDDGFLSPDASFSRDEARNEKSTHASSPDTVLIASAPGASVFSPPSSLDVSFEARERDAAAGAIVEDVADAAKTLDFDAVDSDPIISEHEPSLMIRPASPLRRSVSAPLAPSVRFACEREWAVHDIGALRDLRREKRESLGSALRGWVRDNLRGFVEARVPFARRGNDPDARAVRRALRESRRNMFDNVDYQAAYAETAEMFGVH